jgi:hypothetical protein
MVPIHRPGNRRCRRPGTLEFQPAVLVQPGARLAPGRLIWHMADAAAVCGSRPWKVCPGKPGTQHASASAVWIALSALITPGLPGSRLAGVLGLRTVLALRTAARRPDGGWGQRVLLTSASAVAGCVCPGFKAGGVRSVRQRAVFCGWCDGDDDERGSLGRRG